MARVTKKSLEKENEALITIVQMQSVLISESLKIAKELEERLIKAEKKLKKYKDLDEDMDRFDRSLKPREPKTNTRWH